MKFRLKTQILLLMILGIFTILPTLFHYNLNINQGIEFINTVENQDSFLSNNHLKMSKLSERIHIDNNWTEAMAAGICTGDGTYSNPYLIEDLIIDAYGHDFCILIENSNDYFRIENCTVFNSWHPVQNAGIGLSHVKNGQLVENNCSNDNLKGIQLVHSHNNTISGNILKNNFNGISLSYADNNSIIENLILNNGLYGMLISNCINNNITGCKIGNNGVGVLLHDSINHTFSRNLMDGCGLELFPSDLITLVSHEIDALNTVNEGILYYYTSESSLTSQNFSNAGQVILINCNDSIISNLNTSYTNTGILIFYGNNNTVINNVANNNNGYGILLDLSNYNNVSGNTANENSENGIMLVRSDYNVISKNTANNNIFYGLELRISDFNNISNNVLLSNFKCINEFGCEGNMFYNNNCGPKDIPGFDVLLLIGISSVLIIILKRKMKILN